MKHVAKIIGLFMLFAACTSTDPQVVDPVDKDNIANGGYDMVAYFTDSAAIKGIVENTVEYNGAKYQFASAEHADMFKATPEKYLPACGGYCAFGVANKGKKVPVNPTTYKIINGKLYLFFNGTSNGKPRNTLDEWNKNEEQLLQQLPTQWSKLSN